jgi:hypothetical protein
MKLFFRVKHGAAMAIFFLSPFIINSVVAQDTRDVWTRQFRNLKEMTCNSVTSDNSGNVYSTGYFSGSADFDPGEDSVMLVSVEYSDLYLCKFNLEGKFEWVKQFNGSHYNYFNYENSSVDADKFGNVYLTGASTSLVNFDTISGTYDLSTRAKDFHTLIAKLDSNGNYTWIKQIVGFISHTQSIKVDDDENVYLTGYFRDTLDFDPGPGTFLLNSTWSEEYDVFVMKLNRNGEFIWARQFGSSFRKAGKSIDVDKQGNVYTIGYYRNRCVFDPGVNDSILIATSETDIFVSKLDSNGQFVWAKNFGGAGVDIGMDLAVDKWGDVYFTGYYDGVADFDPGKKTYSCMSNGYSDAFICKLNTNGELLWVKSFGGDGDDQALSVDIDLNSDVYINGVFNNKMDVDPGPDEVLFDSKGEADIFIIKLDNLGNYKWAKQFSGTEYKMLGGIDVNTKGDVFSAGYFKGTVDFAAVNNPFSLVSMGYKDAFVNKITQDITFNTANVLVDETLKPKVYPNPTADDVFIDLGANISQGKITIRNLHGQVVSCFDIYDAAQVKIKLPQLKGLYFIELELLNGNRQTFKVLKSE